MSKRHLCFDFDGVIVFSNELRELAYAELFHGFPEPRVSLFLDFHRKNGGLSRFQKIKWFFDLNDEKISQHRIIELSKDYSKIFEASLNKSYLNFEFMEFVSMKMEKYHFSCVSASETSELNRNLKRLGIDRFFGCVQGSPPEKVQVLRDLIRRGEIPGDAGYIGDSINDYDAALSNKIRFFAYNNMELCGLIDSVYLSKLGDLDEYFF